MKNEIRHTFYFNQKPEEIWAYLTQSELIEQWLMPNDFKPEPGHHFRFTNPNNSFVVCEVVEVKPYTFLSYVWKNDWSITKVPYTSLVTWTLNPVESGTELILVHSGFELLNNLMAHNGGWIFHCNKLSEMLKLPK